MKKILYCFFFFISLTASAQDKIPISDTDYNNNEVEMADTMRSEGKIYVVVAIVLIILLGLIGYTTHIDRKLSRLEKGEDN
jgi:ABC-type amino acid transport system permease subunit